MSRPNPPSHPPARRPLAPKWARYLGPPLAILAWLGAFWLVADRILFALLWEKHGPEFTTEGYADQMRRDLAEGNTGPQPFDYPCPSRQGVVDLSLKINGPFPMNLGGDVVMSVWGDSRLYIGPPQRRIVIRDVPVCWKTDEREGFADPGSWVYLGIAFDDLDTDKVADFSGEQALPIYLWKHIEVDLHPLPVQVYRDGGATTQIIVRPVDPVAPIPENLRYLLR
ncbi:hypothetical protein LX70_00242 [Defluviimonas denitrificans]|uniref:Uncharacterized protein n=1 Tax=Albidovulum denitrificans TaxID=404881 RepID=A0A2S8SCC6_9RHOB|nr:hypothetical protein [Defluviimonas denitrificans]PQV58430.1 hypothetical protein LX70_00242 [Defluviimonas denitrificans]